MKAYNMKSGYFLHIYISQFSGETIYQVYDQVGDVFKTIFEKRTYPLYTGLIRINKFKFIFIFIYFT